MLGVVYGCRCIVGCILYIPYFEEMCDVYLVLKTEND